MKHSRISKQFDLNNAKRDYFNKCDILPKLNDSSVEVDTDEVILIDGFDNIDLDCPQVLKSKAPQYIEKGPIYLRNNKEEVYLKPIQVSENEIYDNNLKSMTLQAEETTKPICDLQSLLIMMAISSNETDKEVETDITNATNKPEPNNEIINNASVEIDNVNFLNIVPLKSKFFLKHETLMIKYVNKWKLYVKNKKNYMEQIRNSAINNFFEKLDKRKNNTDNKAKQSVYDYNTYQHR